MDRQLINAPSVHGHSYQSYLPCAHLDRHWQSMARACYMVPLIMRGLGHRNQEALCQLYQTLVRLGLCVLSVSVSLPKEGCSCQKGSLTKIDRLILVMSGELEETGIFSAFGRKRRDVIENLNVPLGFMSSLRCLRSRKLFHCQRSLGPQDMDSDWGKDEEIFYFIGTLTE